MVRLTKSIKQAQARADAAIDKAYETYAERLDRLAEAERIRAYGIVVWYSLEDRAFIGRCLEIPGAQGIGERPVDALNNAYRAVADHLEHRRTLGLNYPVPGEADKLFARKLQALFAWMKRQQGRKTSGNHKTNRKMV